MPLSTAARRCAGAVFLPSDRRRRRRRIGADDGDAARPARRRRRGVGWDEAFVGASTDDPQRFAADLRAAVHAETGLTCAVGIGETSCRPDGHRLRQAGRHRCARPAGSGSRPWASEPVTAHLGRSASAPGTAWPSAASTPSSTSPAIPRAAGPAAFGPTIGPHRKILGLGGDDAPVVRCAPPRRPAAPAATSSRDVVDPLEIASARGPAGARTSASRSSPTLGGSPRGGPGARGDVLHPHEARQAPGGDHRRRATSSRGARRVLDRSSSIGPCACRRARRPG